MTSNTDNFILYGTDIPESAPEILTAGPLSVTLQNGNLRTIRYLGHEVLRAVSFLVRDKDWGTCAAEITDLVVEADGQRLAIRYSARYVAPSGANLDCRMQIIGDADGSLAFEAEGLADADFETARAGFTVLHPLVGIAGQPVTVEHSGGTIAHANWPDAIDPWQPFMDMVAITHGVSLDIEAETRFEGDVFEMEDQRNWTDGSYKTYVRPLALPWPYMVRKGEPLKQAVRVTIRSKPDAVPAVDDDGAITLKISATDTPLPAIGVGLRPDCREGERQALGVLQEIGAGHLVAHFDPLAGHGLEALKAYAETVSGSGLKLTLELAVPCLEPLDVELQAIADLVRQAALPLDTLFVSPAVDRQSTPPGSKWPDCPPLEDVYAAARKAFPDVRMGGGMLSYFTELNRKRVPGALIDYVSHCTNPIVHAADDLSVMQTFEALAYVVRSTRTIYPTQPYRIGPSTIAMRQNPYGSATKDNPGGARVPMANTDPRHSGRFGAAWTLAYAATVAAAGLEVLTLSTLAGPFGLVAGTGEPAPEGNLRPLAHVISALGTIAGERLRIVETSHPHAVLGLATASRLLLANITPATRRVALGSTPKAISVLAGRGVELAPADTVELGPYECLDIRL